MPLILKCSLVANKNIKYLLGLFYGIERLFALPDGGCGDCVGLGVYGDFPV